MNLISVQNRALYKEDTEIHPTGDTNTQSCIKREQLVIHQSQLGKKNVLERTSWLSFTVGTLTTSND